MWALNLICGDLESLILSLARSADKKHFRYMKSQIFSRIILEKLDEIEISLLDTP